MIMIKKKSVCKTFILSGLLMIFSCSQDPIYYNISQETLPEKPHVPGGPTNMVEFARNGSDLVMYVASGSHLYWYNRASGWDSADYYTPQPGGRIIGLAATNTYLYALCLTGTGKSTVVRRIGKTTVPADNEWKNISITGSSYTLPQTIYTSSDRLFVGAMKNSDTDSEAEFGILYLDSAASLTLQELKGNTGKLSGAASNATNTYYLSSTKGLYKVTGTGTLSADPSFPSGSLSFMGIIKLEDSAQTIVMVARNGGAFYKVKADGSDVERIENMATGNYASGPLLLWVNPTTPTEKILSAGIQGGLYTTTSNSTFTHGYVEFALDAAGYPTGSHHDPTITVANSEQYRASLGKHPINYMHQTSTAVDPRRLFLASTQSAGLWSYKPRTGGPEWNAEN
jgi:hypothetical protein